MVCSCCFISGIYGSEFWHTPSVDMSSILGVGAPMWQPYTFVDISIKLMMIGAVLISCQKVLLILLRLEKRGEKENFPQAILSVAVFFTFMSSSYLYTWLGPLALAPECRWWFFCYMWSAFVEVCVHVMFTHTSGAVLTPSRRFTAWASVLLPLNVCYGNYEKCLTFVLDSVIGSAAKVPVLTPLYDEVLVMRGLCVVSGVVTVYTLHSIVIDVADALNVYVFTLRKRRTKTA